MVNRLFLILLAALAAVSCRHKELSDDNPCGTGNTRIRVVVNWDNPAVQSRTMRMNLFSQIPGVADYGRDEIPSSGEKHIYLNDGMSYLPFCYDYNALSIYFRNEHDISCLEAYFSGMSRATYNTYASPVPGEATYAPPAAGEFYIDACAAICNVDASTQQEIHFYPKNILRQFTFRVNNIVGWNNIADARGAASGMSAAFVFNTNSPSSVRATMLFGDVQTKYDAVNGYGYLEGTFYTFCPQPPYQNRFTMELYSNAGKYYGAYWDVSSQVAASIADRDAKLALDGYDILIMNDPATHIPEIDPGNGSGSGFDIGVGDWGNEVGVYL